MCSWTNTSGALQPKVCWGTLSMLWHPWQVSSTSWNTHSDSKKHRRFQIVPWKRQCASWTEWNPGQKARFLRRHTWLLLMRPDDYVSKIGILAPPCSKKFLLRSPQLMMGATGQVPFQHVQVQDADGVANHRMEVTQKFLTFGKHWETLRLSFPS